MKNTNAVEIENLSVYYKQTPALSDINLCVKEGDFLGIIGPNGGGKTTLLRAILGLVPSLSGNISIYGKSIAKKKTAIGYVSQFSDIDRLFPITAKEVILTGRLPGGLSLFHTYTKDDHRKTDSITKITKAGCIFRPVFIIH